MGNQRGRILSFLLLFFISFVSLSSSKDNGESSQISLLEEIVLSKRPDTLEVRILCSTYTSHRQFELTNPNKIVIDFQNIEDIQADRHFEVNDFGIKAIRAGMFKSNIARVVFDLRAEIPPYKIERIQDGIKVTFSLSKDKDGPSQMGFLEELTLSSTPNSLEFKILCSIYTSHRPFVLTNPNKIVIDFRNIEDVQTGRYFEVNDSGIQTIRAGMFKSNIARVVFDLKAEIPPYKIEEIQRGIKITFWPVEEPEVKREEMPPQEKQEEEVEEKAVKEKDEQPETVPMIEPPQRLPAEIKESPDKTVEQPAETKEILEELTEVLDEIQDEKRMKRKQYIRIEALGGAFQPQERTLKDIYERGLIYGVELNVGIWEFAEFWIAQKYFNKKVVDKVTAVERKINLIPLEWGLKFRLSKGKVNPYLGFGASYYQYKEIDLTGEIKDKSIGYIGLAGIFFKIKGGLLFDIHARYSYCRVLSGEDKLNVGGFHIGGGLGFEY